VVKTTSLQRCAKLLAPTVDGCFFHLQKALWHKLQELVLTSFFFKSPEFQTCYSMMSALGYVPNYRIVEYYETVILKKLKTKEQEAERDSKEDLEEEEEDKKKKQTEEEKQNKPWSPNIEINILVAHFDRT